MRHEYHEIQRAKEEIKEVCELSNPGKSSVCPRVHLSSPCGYMATPGAPIFFGGVYHTYYPFTPFSMLPGKLLVGHATSEDGIKWEHGDPVIAPALTYNREGINHVCTVKDGDELCIFYTAKPNGQPVFDGLDGDKNHVYMARSKDGIEFSDAEEVLIPALEYVSFNHPRVFRGEKCWWMVAAVETTVTNETEKELQSHVYLFSSLDLITWCFDRVLISAEEGEGVRWSCPDFFELDGEHILLVTVQGMYGRQQYADAFEDLIKAEEELHSSDGHDSDKEETSDIVYAWNDAKYTVGVIRGEWEEGCAFIPRKPFTPIDYGADLYGVQTFLSAGNERFITGLAIPPGRFNYTLYYGYCGSASLPRKLSIEKGSLNISFIDLDRYMTKPAVKPPFFVEDTHIVVMGDTPCYRFSLSLDLENATSETLGFYLGEGFRFELERDHSECKQFTMNIARTYPDVSLQDHTSLTVPASGHLSITGVFDRSMIEIALSDGRIFTYQVLPVIGERFLKLFSWIGRVEVTEFFTQRLKID